MKDIAIIGAGMAGLTLAQALGDSANITIFEKSSGFGGRMATRRRLDYQFDHGAQFFTARTPPFRAFLKAWIQRGTVVRWNARFVEMERDRITSQRQWDEDFPHYVAQPTMRSLCEGMATGLNVQLDTEVDRLLQVNQCWQLIDKNAVNLGTYDWVILAIPAAQAATLLPDVCCFKQDVASRTMLGCYSLMLGFEQALPLAWDAALVKGADISWVCNNHSKPGRPGKPTLLVHATNRWAEDNMQMQDDAVIDHLKQETAAVTGLDLSHARHVDLHRWRYANIRKQQGERSRIDTRLQLAATGDWCIKGRIESAYLSGLDLAEKLQALTG